MLTVHEVSELTGVSVRALHHYDDIGLLKPHKRTEAGYRLYNDEDLLRLQQIMLFRELEFSLADIRRIIDASDFDRHRALEQQIRLLELHRERIDRLLEQARAMRSMGVRALSFEAFDKSELEEYARQAKQAWGDTPQWAEYEERRAGRTSQEEHDRGRQLMTLFVPFGTMVAEGASPASDEAQAQVAAIQRYITKHMYTCTNEILARLGRAYGSGGAFTRNINAVAGQGAAEFAAKAVELYCS